MELFAGSRSATRAVSMAGYRATCIDIEDYKGYGISKGPGSPFDILSNSGFAKLSSIQNKISLERGPRGEWVKSFNLEPFPGPLSKDIVFQVTPIHIEALPYVDINLSLVSMLRTAMFAILQSDPAGFVIWMGILCATWSAMSRGSTRRCFLAPLGLDSLPCVSQANVMVSRCNT